jgi:hypothetical protein
MRAECGDDVLTRMEPYFIDRDAARIDSEIAQMCGKCAQKALDASIQLVASAIQKNLDKVSAIHAKFGVDYP